MILLWGVWGDTPLRCVYEALERAGADTVFLDQLAPRQATLTTDAPSDGAVLRIDHRFVELAAVRAAYIRPYTAHALQQDAAACARVHDTLLGWCELTPATVLNRPSAMTPNHSKPYQASLIAALGFATPDTLITTDAAAALAFWEYHGDVVYKSISSVRSIVTRLGPSHRARLVDVRNCPTQFQAYIPGTDYRVHVVGDECFCCEISSTADDYRYAADAGAGVHVRACRLPEDVLERCRSVTRASELHFAGIDLRRTPAGAWYCFEVNPSPAFSFFENASGQPIADAVARLLASRRDLPGKQEAVRYEATLHGGR
jgi:hypothetical protein